MADFWITNRELETVLTEVHARWDAESYLRLFTNNYEPDATTELADLTEGAWDTYAEVDLTGEWEAPTMAENGRWTSRTSVCTFLAPTAGGPFTVYGAYVVDDTEVVGAVRFDAPVTMEVGGFQLQLRVTREEAARVLIESLP